MQFELLKSFAQEGPLTATVSGDCMCGSIPEGSQVQLQSRRFYRTGDVIAFRRGDGKIVCHRFLGYIPSRKGWRVITRAENSRHVDVPVSVRLVLGHVAGLDGKPYGPGFKHRSRALVQYFTAIIRRPLKRFGFRG